MRKHIWIFCILLIILVINLNKNRSSEKVVSSEIDETKKNYFHIIKQHPTITSPVKDSITENVSDDRRRIPASQNRRFHKQKTYNPFASYPHSPLSKEYVIVQGITGSFQRNSNLINSIGGIHFYENGNILDGYPVIFDKSKEKYGIWTGEIVIEAPEEVLGNLLNSFDIDVIQKSPGRSILKPRLYFNINSDLKSIETFSGVENLELDLKFSKLQRQ